MALVFSAMDAGVSDHTGQLHVTSRSLTALPTIRQTRELYAAANRIADIEDLSLSTGLLLADLSWNEITQVPSSLPLTLVSLNLSHNRLCDLTATLSAIASLPELRILHLKGNPFCLHPHYLSAVQHALPLLQHFDGTRVQLAAPVCKDTVASSTNSFVAVGHSLSSVAAQQRLHICFSQLSVQNTVPCRLSIPGAAVEPAPPAYYYYLQLRSRGDGLLCGFPSVLTPQGELARWQAQQSADQSMAGGKKPAGKKAPAGKAGKADASATEQRNAWYQEGSLTAAIPIAPDVSTRDWLRSGMTVQLLQHPASAQTSASSASVQGQTDGKAEAAVQRCIARGVCQPAILLEGSAKEWSCKLSLLEEVPLFDARGSRLGIEAGDRTDPEVASVEVRLQLLTQ